MDKTHITETCSCANRALGFIHRNVKIRSPRTKEKHLSKWLVVDNVVLAPEQHGHSPDDSMVDRAKFRETMGAQVIEDPARPVKRVYDAAVSNAHIQGGEDRPELDNFHTFRTMLNRTNLLPGIPYKVDDVEIDGPLAEIWLKDRYLLVTQ